MNDGSQDPAGTPAGRPDGGCGGCRARRGFWAGTAVLAVLSAAALAAFYLARRA